MRISISFDPLADSAADLSAVIARIYGGAAAHTVTISHADNPETGEDTGTATSTTNAAGGATLDSTGLRWDPRIHATPASQIANGTWRAKRNVDKTLVAQVTAELRGTPAATGLPVGLTPITLPAAPPPAVAGPALVVPPPPPAAPPTVYESFVNWISDHIKAATMGVTEEWVAQVLTQYQIADGKVVNLQNAAPEKITEIRTAIAGALQVPAA